MKHFPNSPLKHDPTAFPLSQTSSNPATFCPPFGIQAHKAHMGAAALALCAAFILIGDTSLFSTAYALEYPSPTAQTRWQWPLDPPHIVTRRFNPPAQPWLPGHRGVDLQVECGQVVYAPFEGTLSLARHIVDTDVVVLTHDYRRSTFSPVTSTLPVGTQVKTGQAIGVITNECDKVLNWGVKTGPDSYLNPLKQMVGRIVLKPWEAGIE